MKDKKININAILMIILLISFCFPNFALFSVGNQKIMLYRLLVLIYSLGIVVKRNIIVPSKNVVIILIFMTIISLVCSINYGFDRLLFDYMFAFLILVDVCSIGKYISKDEWINIIQKVSIISIVSILINMFIQKDSITFFIQHQLTNHPIYNCIFTGGWNLEATWPALFVFFYANKPKKGYIFLIFSFLVSILLSSRIGIIINFVGLIYLTNSVLKKSVVKTKKRIYSLIAIFVIIVILLFAMNFGITDSIKNRMLNIGKDSGSVSRFNMWKNIFTAFLNSPFGYGCGNAIKGVKAVSKVWIGEDNVHNLFFQMLLDFGFIGVITYSIIVFNFIKRNIKEFFNNPIVAFMIMYIFVGLIQFKGAELIVYYVLAIYYVLKNQEKEELKNV